MKRLCKVEHMLLIRTVSLGTFAWKQCWATNCVVS